MPKAWLEDTRKAWEREANEALERAGYGERIDHRSLAERRDAAERSRRPGARGYRQPNVSRHLSELRWSRNVGPSEARRVQRRITSAIGRGAFLGSALDQVAADCLYERSDRQGVSTRAKREWIDGKEDERWVRQHGSPEPDGRAVVRVAMAIRNCREATQPLMLKLITLARNVLQKEIKDAAYRHSAPRFVNGG